MDLKEQKYVCALAEYGNLTRAAEKLYISQPALSIYINNVENNLGVKLFERNGKRFVLTYAGERYVERAKKMLKLEYEFNAEMEDVIREYRGRIRIGVSLRRGPWLIPPLVAEYEQKRPGIEVSIREGNLSELSEMVKNYELDMVILNRADVSEGMETRLILSEEFLLVTPQIHPINEMAEYVPGEKYRRIRPEYLNGQVLILQTPFQSSRKIEDSILKHQKIVPSRIRIIRSAELTIQMVAEGLGIGFVREGYAANIRYKKAVNYYTLGTENLREDLVVAYKKGLRLPDYMENFIVLLQKQGKEILS